MPEQVLAQARQKIVESWPESADSVIHACESTEKFCGDSRSFMEHCTACGGDWCGMLLSGIRELWPSVFSVIPENMGSDGFEAFANLCYVLQLCGVDTSK